MNLDALDLIERCYDTRNPILDLSNCGLTNADFNTLGVMHNLLKKCTHIQELNLSSTWWDREGRYTTNRRVSQNGGERNFFRSIPLVIGQLTRLKKLICCGYGGAEWTIKDLEVLSELKELEYLDLSGAEITEIKHLNKLTSLKVLDISNNRINKIEGLDNLVNLQYLVLYGNKIKKLEGLTFLKDLRTLSIGDNLIEKIENLEALTELRKLILHTNKLVVVENLNFSEKIEMISLSHNGIKNVEHFASLASFKSLKIIDLNGNNISDITPLLTFLNRKKGPLNIVFQKNAIRKKGKINLENNPLESPPIEIVRLGTKAILGYYIELEKQGVEYLYEAKMLIVGQPRAGKSSLRYKLFNTSSILPEEEKTTRGIDIEQLTFETTDREGGKRKFKYNIWDFGGQQIYQTTHQFFLTHRSLYVLVMDTGKDSIGNDDTTVNYWLQVVELLGNNSPMLLVKNEKNERQINIDLAQKKARFEFLKSDYNIDLNALIPNTPQFKSERLNAFNKLRDDIEIEIKRLPLIGLAMPKNWVQIREELQKMSQEHPYISRQDYIVLCRSFGINEFNSQMELSKIFHDLGVFLHFQNYSTLEEIIILQNVWATDAVFAVLDNIEVQKNKGELDERALTKIWKEKGYDSIIHTKLLALMMQFELCYKVNDYVKSKIYIVPELLPEIPHKNYKWKSDNDLPLQYRYDFMPKGLLTKLIVRLHKNIDVEEGQQSVWKTGVKINGNSIGCPNTLAEITEAWNNKQLLIRAQGPFSKDLVSKITYQIDLLNDEFFKTPNQKESSQKSKWYKMVPCNCSICEKSIDKHFYDYNQLLERKEYGKTTIECVKKPFLTVDINKLLGEVFSKKNSALKAENLITKGKKVFISYSHKDEKWKEKLQNNLATLRNQEVLFDWDDRQIEAGLWDEQIEEAMKTADIFLLLITHNFLSSSYITSKEITTAYSRYKNGKAKIFPIICDTCDWQLQPLTKSEKEKHPIEKKDMYVWLGKFQAFPKDGKAIKKWRNQQDGFLDVINQLKKYL